MLRSLTVHSFKSVRRTTIELGAVNVFVGANGSGKSNVLEALGVLSAATAGRVDDEALLRRGVRPGVPALYKASFHNLPTEKHIYLEATSEGATYRVTLWNPIKDPTPLWKFKTERLESPGKNLIGRSPANIEYLKDTAGYIALRSVTLPPEDPRSLLLATLAQYSIYSPDTPTLRGLVPDSQTREPVGLAGGRLAEGVSEILKGSIGHARRHQVLEMVDWLMGINTGLASDLPISPSVPRPTRALRLRDRFMADKRDILSAYEASEGVLYLLFGMVLACNAKAPPTFAIDNFDHALNPRLARAYAKSFCDWVLARQGAQALLTSHNPLILDGLPLGDDRVRLFAVDRTDSGTTIVRRVEVSEKVLEAAEKGVSLSRQWVMGNFGGVPSNV